MDDKTWLGTVAELKAQAAYAHAGWDVFSQVSGKSPFDLLVCRSAGWDATLSTTRRIQVKGTQALQPSGSYLVNLRSTRHNSQGHKVKKLDPTSYDELAVYIEPIDTLVFLTPSEVRGRDAISFGHKVLATARKLPACICDLEPTGRMGCSECPR